MITFNPHIPLTLWLPLALAAVALLVVYGVVNAKRLPPQRFAGVIALMGISLGVPLMILLNPMWVQTQPPPPGQPLLTVLIDRSASMATADGDSQGRSRLAVAMDIGVEVVEQLGKDYEIRLRTFDETSSPTDLPQLKQLAADGPATNLAGSLEQSLGEDRPPGQAVLVLSDGIDTSNVSASRLRQAGQRAKALSTPVFVRTIGTQQGVLDLQLAVHQSQELAFSGQQVPIVVRLSHTYPSPQTTELTLSLDGQPLESREVTFNQAATSEQLFYVAQEESGLYRYEIAAAPLEGEVTDLNNTATLLLRVVDQPVSVLLLEGKPYWDTKFLIRTLAADPSMELTSVVQMAPGRFLERKIGHAAPRPTAENEGESDAAENGDDSEAIATTRNEWKIYPDARGLLSDPEYLSQFQIIVLGRSTEAYLTEDALIELRAWLTGNEGSLVCFRGSPAAQLTQRLSSLMPVDWSAGRESRFRVALTDSGQAMQWLPLAGESLELLPSLATSGRPEDTKPLATVLATSSGEGESIPLITYLPAGSGRVVVVEGAGMWRWAFLPPEHQDHDAIYGTLWRSLVRWLVSNVGLLPNERVALRPDTVMYNSTQMATATLLLRDEAWESLPQVAVTSEALEKPITIAPQAQGSGGVYRVNFGQLPPGRYTAKVMGASDDEASAATSFDVTGNLRERLDVVARPEVMNQLAQLSGGMSLDGSQAEELPAKFQQAMLEHRLKSRPDRVLRTTAWDRWWVLVAALGLWACTWGVRRWSGLV